MLFMCSPIGVVVMFGRQMHTRLVVCPLPPPQASVLDVEGEKVCSWMHSLGHGGKGVRRVDQEVEVVGVFIGIVRRGSGGECLLERGRLFREKVGFFFRKRGFCFTCFSFHR